MLDFNGILPEKTSMIPNININTGGLSREDLSEEFSSLKETINSKETLVLQNDKYGQRQFIKRQNTRTELLNRRVKL